MLNHRLILLSGYIAVFFIGIFPFYVQAKPTISAPAASLNMLTAGQTAIITITTQVTSEPTKHVIATGVYLYRVNATGKGYTLLGNMHDDGTQGDSIAGDGIYTLVLQLHEQSARDFKIFVSAAFYKLLNRVLSDVTTIPIVEKINGIVVPPQPDGTINKTTIGGIDSNNDKIRDDIERLIALEFGEKPEKYNKAINHARTLQIAITQQTEEAALFHIEQIRCINDSDKLTQLKKITIATLDTSERRNAYGKTFAGALISSKECP